jgi:hypothetical protein
MADEAKVRSVESLEYFRSALLTFLSKARKAVGHAEDGVKRGRYWVEQEQHNHWMQEGKKRARKLAQAQAELLTAKLSKFRDGIMLQEKLARRAKQDMEEAENKLRQVKRWTREFDRTFDPATKGLTQLREFLEHDIPRGVSWLEQALRTLGAYLEREKPPGNAAAAPVEAPPLTEPESPAA